MDKVRFTPLERAEQEDLEALSDLPYEYVERAIGSLLGVGDLSSSKGGLLVGPSLSYNSAVGLLTVSSCTFIYIAEGEAAVDANNHPLIPQTRVIRYNSSATDHLNAPVDISAARTPGTTYTLYARPIEIQSDSATRRRWDLVSQQELSYSPLTRLRERVEFSASVTPPAGVGWTALLNYEVDAGGVLTHTPISGLDHADAKILNILNPSLSPNTLKTELFLNEATVGTQSRALGFLGLASLVKHALYRAYHDGANDLLYTPNSNARWYTSPAISLGEARERITAIETATAGLWSVFPFNIEIQMQMINGVASENVEITQTNQAPFTNEISVYFDNRYRSSGALPSPWSTTSFHTLGGALNRIGHLVLAFDSSFDGGEVMLATAAYTVHTIRDSNNTSTQWSSIAGSSSGWSTSPLTLAFLEETDLPNPTTPAPNARSLGSRSYVDDDSAVRTVSRAVKLAAYIDASALSSDLTDNDGTTITINYQLLVRR